MTNNFFKNPIVIAGLIIIAMISIKAVPFQSTTAWDLPASDGVGGYDRKIVLPSGMVDTGEIGKKYVIKKYVIGRVDVTGEGKPIVFSINCKESTYLADNVVAVTENWRCQITYIENGISHTYLL